MEFRFVADELRFAMSEGGYFSYKTEARPSHYGLNGLVSAHINDEFGPPPEWKFLTTRQVLSVQQRPLRATVHFFSAEAWAAQYGSASEPQIGRAFIEEGEETMYRANAAAVAESQALVYYSPPPEKDEYAQLGGRNEAVVQIQLRLSASAFREWTALAGHLIVSPPKPCRVTVWNVHFAIDDHASADTGHPTWQRFLRGQFNAPASDGFSLSMADSWQELSFS